jgi:hypothetical protein
VPVLVDAERPIVSTPEPDGFAGEWAAAWDRRDVDAVLDLHFDIVGVYVGVSVLVINYRNQRGELVCEVLEFDGGLVRRGHRTYLSRS